MSLTDPTVSQNHVLRAFKFSLFDVCRFSGAEQFICFYFFKWLTLRSWSRLLFGWYTKLLYHNNYDLYWSSMTSFCRKYSLKNYLFYFADNNGNALLPTPSIFKSFGEYKKFFQTFPMMLEIYEKKFFFVAQAELVILVAVVYPQLFSAILYQFSRADFCKRLILWNIVTTLSELTSTTTQRFFRNATNEKVIPFFKYRVGKVGANTHCNYYAKICFSTSAQMFSVNVLV